MLDSKYLNPFVYKQISSNIFRNKSAEKTESTIRQVLFFFFVDDYQ